MAKAELSSARAARDQASVDVEDAKRQLATERQLAVSGHSPERAVADAEFAYRRARAALSRATANVSERRAQVKRLERQLGETTLAAPFDGTISVQYLNQGAIAGPGSPVVRLISSDTLVVKFAVPPDQAGELDVGDEIVVTLDSGGRTIAAVVEEIAPELDAASLMIFMEASLSLAEDQRETLQSGLAAWVKPK
jgi:RND family efflux transporter MFP subunit